MLTSSKDQKNSHQNLKVDISNPTEMLPQTAEELSAEVKVDEKRYDSVNKNIQKDKVVLQSWDTSANLAAQATRDYFDTVRLEAKPVQQRFLPTKEWSGVVEEIEGNTMEIIVTTATSKASTIYEETDTLMTITTTTHFLDIEKEAMTEEIIENVFILKVYQITLNTDIIMML